MGWGRKPDTLAEDPPLPLVPNRGPQIFPFLGGGAVLGPGFSILDGEEKNRRREEMKEKRIEFCSNLDALL